MRGARSALFYVVLFVSTIYLGFTAYIVHRLTGRYEPAHACARLWARVNLWVAGSHVHMEGAHRIKRGQAYIFAANHQSWFDIFALLACIPVSFRWLAKQELFSVPVLGIAMEACGAIPIDRRDRRKALVSIEQAAGRARMGASICIFPEGTRSHDGVLQEFKSGGFILAIKSQQPIVPVSISGSHRVLPKKGKWIIRPGNILMTISEPILTEGLTMKGRDRLMERVRQAVCRYLPQGEGGILANSLMYRRV
jgi:1-acyl-sn-glycerol-3-phosphate acyltransferase